MNPAYWLVLALFFPGPTAVPTPLEAVGAPGTDIILMPESERTLRRLVVGLDANQTKYFMLPETAAWKAKTHDPRVRYLRRQLYWLNFELRHGGILRAAPGYTRFFFALPDARVIAGSLGNEREVFSEYLRARVGWSEKEIARRVRFFSTPSIVPFPRDMAEPLGRDRRQRLVLAIGDDSDSGYAEPLRRLVKAYPDDFVLKSLPEINTEGGDVSVAWLPDGKVGVLIGYHRILRYLESKYAEPLSGKRIQSSWIERGREAFQRAFFGLEVLIIGEETLRDPRLINDELFHLDMIVNVMKGNRGVVAFVPSYHDAPVDAISHAPLASEIRDRIQKEYDRVASALDRRGYRVVRLPFRDHPDRTPVQVGDFVDQQDQQPSVFLGKYPYHLDLPDGRNPQRTLQASLDTLETVVQAWRQAPTGPHWTGVVRGLAAVWREMDAASAAPNPTFDLQARIYESEGIRVIPVPIYPTGEGGLHCLLLN